MTAQSCSERLRPDAITARDFLGACDGQRALDLIEIGLAPSSPVGHYLNSTTPRREYSYLAAQRQAIGGMVQVNDNGKQCAATIGNSR